MAQGSCQVLDVSSTTCDARKPGVHSDAEATCGEWQVPRRAECTVQVWLFLHVAVQLGILHGTLPSLGAFGAHGSLCQQLSGHFGADAITAIRAARVQPVCRRPVRRQPHGLHKGVSPCTRRRLVDLLT